MPKNADRRESRDIFTVYAQSGVFQCRPPAILDIVDMNITLNIQKAIDRFFWAVAGILAYDFLGRVILTVLPLPGSPGWFIAPVVLLALALKIVSLSLKPTTDQAD